MPAYKYSIPLEETDEGLEPVYEFPEGEYQTRYKQDDHMVIIQDRVIPHFHRDSVAVEVEAVDLDATSYNW